MKRTLLLALLLLAFSALPRPATGQPANSPYIVEWVYKVKRGYQDEFRQIFQKYQIATLNKEKELGSVLKYEVFRPGLHTSEDHRWDYRVIIYYKDVASSSQGGKVERQLFPDQATMKREEQRRWELTEVHWDLPIRQMDPNAAEWLLLISRASNLIRHRQPKGALFQIVIDRLKYFYEHENSNIHRAAHELAARATDAYEEAREKVRAFLNAGSVKEIVFVRGATEAINMVAQSWGRQFFGKTTKLSSSPGWNITPTIVP